MTARDWRDGKKIYRVKLKLVVELLLAGLNCEASRWEKFKTPRRKPGALGKRQSKIFRVSTELLRNAARLLARVLQVSDEFVQLRFKPVVFVLLRSQLQFGIYFCRLVLLSEVR